MVGRSDWVLLTGEVVSPGGVGDALSFGFSKLPEL
eukprot:COSAG02_NODE_28165_length_594_cov_141.076479_1_plen_34_part_10